jgi:SAM-dependent methyltransferase
MAEEVRPTLGDRVKFKLLRLGRRNVGAIKRTLRPPSWPSSPDGKLRLHVGCGMIDAPGFVNVDLFAAPHVHVQSSIDDLSIFPDGCADLVYACHCLEHFGFRHTAFVLEEWARVLRPGGVLRIAVPDFAVIARAYGAGVGLRTLQSLLLGGQDYRLNFHAAVFDEPMLGDLMGRVGVADIRRWDPATIDHHDFIDESAITCPIGADSVLPLSLNLEGRKQ